MPQTTLPEVSILEILNIIVLNKTGYMHLYVKICQNMENFPNLGKNNNLEKHVL